MQSRSRVPSPENRPVYRVFQHNGVRCSETYLLWHQYRMILNHKQHLRSYYTILTTVCDHNIHSMAEVDSLYDCLASVNTRTTGSVTVSAEISLR